MVTSPSVPPYGEAGRLEDILEKKKKQEKGKRKSEQCSKYDIIGWWLELNDGDRSVCDGFGE